MANCGSVQDESGTSCLVRMQESSQEIMRTNSKDGCYGTVFRGNMEAIINSGCNRWNSVE